MNTYIQEKQGEFEKVIDFFRKEISVLRTGRANPAVLEGVMVDAYGTKTPLNGVASITVPDGQSMLVAPWDKSILKDVEKSIVEAELGLGVANDGDKLRLTMPKMTEENRRDIVKRLNEKQENSRITLRQIRDDIKTEIEQAEKDKEITEDDKYKFIQELDEEINKQNNILKELRDKKEEDIMTI
jgi:ribosome recycling factor